MAVLSHGYDPDKAAEITRLYTLPGSPRNTPSVFDRFLKERLLKEGVELIMTTAMPEYAKNAATTVSGGMNKVLFVKPLKHTFYRSASGNIVAMNKRAFSQSQNAQFVCETHPSWGNLNDVLEVFMPLIRKPYFDVPEKQVSVLKLKK